MWERVNFTRNVTLRTLEAIEEAQWDAQSEGFSNTVKWNAGHTYVVMESLLKAADPSYESNVEKYAPFFAPGTKPADWLENPASKEEIMGLLKGQIERVQAHFADHLADAPANEVKIGPLVLTSIDDVLNFVLFHEGLHLGTIQSQMKVM
ncbi:DinB family protein [Bacillus sp. REN10]|uniref:DinB family protein n=1 Tax=Bacillus sp. REN10 TaxID=2782541 RepID=UPI001EED962A|nr:DinB family protein [Bacillus sp. REN10]